MKPIKSLFFRRHSDVPKEFSTEISKEVRFTIISYIISFFKEPSYSTIDEYMNVIYRPEAISEYLINLEREFGKKISKENNPLNQICDFLTNSKDSEFLSALEILFSQENNVFKGGHNQYGAKKFRELVDYIHEKFKIEKIGYSIIESSLDDLPFMIVSYNSSFLYEECINKTRILLGNHNFNNALADFDLALDFYRKDHHKESIYNAQKAYESVLKKILDLKGIILNPKKQTKIYELVCEVKKALEIEPRFNDTLDKVVALLDSGPNTVRNLEDIGHGSSEKKKYPLKIYNEFVLRTVGTYIVFLIEMYEYKK